MTSMSTHDQDQDQRRDRAAAAGSETMRPLSGERPASFRQTHDDYSNGHSNRDGDHRTGHRHDSARNGADHRENTRPRRASDRILDQSGAPLAADLGAPAVLGNCTVALEIGAPSAPVALHCWNGHEVETIPMSPTQAQVWARAGRLTLVNADGGEYRLTILAPKEGSNALLGAHWPLKEPDNRVMRIASAAVHDVGDILFFPAWLARTAHVSGERNHELARIVLLIRKASPSTAVYYGQTFSHMHARPDQHHPYEHHGLVGHEGWPREL